MGQNDRLYGKSCGTRRQLSKPGTHLRQCIQLPIGSPTLFSYLLGDLRLRAELER